MKPKNKSLQLYPSDRIESDRDLSKTEIARFISEFQELLQGNEGKRKLISLRVPETLLSQFKTKSQLTGVKYQTQILNLMRQWLK